MTDRPDVISKALKAKAQGIATTRPRHPITKKFMSKKDYDNLTPEVFEEAKRLDTMKAEERRKKQEQPKEKTKKQLKEESKQRVIEMMRQHGSYVDQATLDAREAKEREAKEREVKEREAKEREAQQPPQPEGQLLKNKAIKIASKAMLRRAKKQREKMKDDETIEPGKRRAMVQPETGVQEKRLKFDDAPETKEREIKERLNALSANTDDAPDAPDAPRAPDAETKESKYRYVGGLLDNIISTALGGGMMGLRQKANEMIMTADIAPLPPSQRELNLMNTETSRSFQRELERELGIPPSRQRSVSQPYQQQEVKKIKGQGYSGDILTEAEQKELNSFISKLDNPQLTETEQKELQNELKTLISYDPNIQQSGLDDKYEDKQSGLDGEYEGDEELDYSEHLYGYQRGILNKLNRIKERLVEQENKEGAEYVRRYIDVIVEDIGFQNIMNDPQEREQYQRGDIQNLIMHNLSNMRWLYSEAKGYGSSQRAVVDNELRGIIVDTIASRADNVIKLGQQEAQAQAQASPQASPQAQAPTPEEEKLFDQFKKKAGEGAAVTAGAKLTDTVAGYIYNLLYPEDEKTKVDGKKDDTVLIDDTKSESTIKSTPIQYNYKADSGVNIINANPKYLESYKYDNNVMEAALFSFNEEKTVSEAPIETYDTMILNTPHDPRGNSNYIDSDFVSGEIVSFPEDEYEKITFSSKLKPPEYFNYNTETLNDNVDSPLPWLEVSY